MSDLELLHKCQERGVALQASLDAAHAEIALLKAEIERRRQTLIFQEKIRRQQENAAIEESLENRRLREALEKFADSKNWGPGEQASPITGQIKKMWWWILAEPPWNIHPAEFARNVLEGK